MKKLISKILSIGAFVGFAGAFFSCEDALETKVYDKIVPESFFHSEADLKAAVTGVEQYISGRGASGTSVTLYTSHVVAYLVPSMISSDELEGYWESGNNRWTWTSSGDPGASWTYVSVCAKITDLINQFEKVTTVKKEIVDRYIAELRGVRAQYMHVIYTLYGPVNVKLDPTTLIDEASTPRLTNADWITAFEADLQAVLSSNMPDRYTKGSNEWGLVSKDYFRMLAIRHYMNQRNWAKAESYCREIINSGAYSLVTAGDGVFSAYDVAVSQCPNPETIFSTPANSKYGNIWNTECLPGSGVATQGPGTGYKLQGWYGIGMTWEHYHRLWGKLGDDSFNKDTRCATIMYEYKDRANKIAKEKPSGSGESLLRAAIPVKFANWYLKNQVMATEYLIEQPVYRLAEVYLTLAECIVRQKGTITDEALGYVRAIRERAGLSSDLSKDLAPSQTVIPTSSPNAFIEYLLWERGRELYCEGQRREDLIRYNKFAQRSMDQGWITSVQDNQFRNLFPIPNSTILQGKGVILQNPGYTVPTGTGYYDTSSMAIFNNK